MCNEKLHCSKSHLVAPRVSLWELAIVRSPTHGNRPCRRRLVKTHRQQSRTRTCDYRHNSQEKNLWLQHPGRTPGRKLAAGDEIWVEKNPTIWPWGPIKVKMEVWKLQVDNRWQGSTPPPAPPWCRHWSLRKSVYLWLVPSHDGQLGAGLKSPQNSTQPTFVTVVCFECLCASRKIASPRGVND